MKRYPIGVNSAIPGAYVRINARFGFLSVPVARVHCCAAWFLAVVLLSFTLPANAQDDIERERSRVREGANEVLADLYARQPSARRVVEQAAGYGVFRNFGMKLMFAGGGKGQGIVVDNRTGEETFMKMVEVQAGLGFGIKKFSVVFIFENERVMREFIDVGWEVGGQATAAAKSDTGGDELAVAMSVKPGVWMYQLTDKGLAAELTGKGTRYYRDKDLN